VELATLPAPFNHKLLAECGADRLRHPAFDLVATLHGIDDRTGVSGVNRPKDADLAIASGDRHFKALHIKRDGAWSSAAMYNALKRNASAICLGGDVSEANMAIPGLHMAVDQMAGLARDPLAATRQGRGSRSASRLPTLSIAPRRRRSGRGEYPHPGSSPRKREGLSSRRSLGLLGCVEIRNPTLPENRQ
jgi:hypothetical protein